MTGAQTDRVTTAKHLMAVTQILKLASPLFRLGMHSMELSGIDDASANMAFDHWYTLRDVASQWLNNGCTRLLPETREKMVAALKFAHELAHDTHPGAVPKVMDCGCSTAETIKDLTVLCLNADGIPCA